MKRNRLTIFCPPTPIMKKGIIIAITKMAMFISPCKKLLGKTVASKTAKVGEHVEKTGPKDAPKRTAPNFPRLSLLLLKKVWLFVSFKKLAHFSQACGNSKLSPKRKSSIPDAQLQNESGTDRAKLVPLISSEKRKTEAPSEPTTIHGRIASFSLELPTTIVGSKNRLQGASTVRKPATKEISQKAIYSRRFKKLFCIFEKLGAAKISATEPSAFTITMVD